MITDEGIKEGCEMKKMNVDSLKRTTLILTQTNPENDMMFNAWKKAGLNADIIFRPQNKAIRLIRRLWADGLLPGCSFWYGNWKKELSKYDTVVVHADQRTRTVPRYIHEIKPDMRVIYWYWNPVNKNTLPDLTNDKKIECWSFDEDDCKKYRMNKNIQYYYEQTGSQNETVEYDVYFVGHDKGRKKKITEIKNQLARRNISGKFDLIKESDALIPYSEVQRRIQKAKAIIEVTQAGQIGCTLRALEALFFGKKLITTNPNIEKEDFYNSQNIYIYGKNNLNDLQAFLDTPYDNSSDQFRDKHTVDAWFMNFFVGGDT